MPVREEVVDIKLVILILFGTIMTQLSLGINAVLFPLKLQSMGLSNFMIGLVMACEVLAVVCISRSMMKIVARLRMGPAIVVATLIRFSALTIMMQLQTYFVWLVCIFVYGMATSLVLISLQSWFGALSLGKVRGLILGLFSASLSAGVALGPVLLHLSGTTGRLPWLLNLGCIVLAGLPMLLGARTMPVVDGYTQPRIAYSIRGAKRIMYGALFGGVAFFGLPAFLTIFGTNSGLSPGNAAFLLTAFMIGSIVLGPLVSSLSDYVSRKTIVDVCIFASLLCAAYLPLVVYEYKLALGILVAWGGAQGAIYAIGLTSINETFRSEDHFSANIAYSLCDCCGGVVGIVLIGLAMDYLGSEGMAYVIVSCAIAYFIFALSTYSVPPVFSSSVHLTSD